MAYNNLYDGTSAYKIEEYNNYNRKVQQKQDEYKASVKKRNILNLKKILVITLIVFGVSAAFLWTNALLLQSSAEVTALTSELDDTKARNTQIAFAISSGTDLVEIEEKAIADFGMQKPEGYQNVYVDVVQSDYTKMAQKPVETTGFIDELIKNLKSFLAYIS